MEHFYTSVWVDFNRTGEGAANACIRKIRWSMNDSKTGEVEGDTSRMRKTSPRWFAGLTAGFREVLDTLALLALLGWQINCSGGNSVFT